MHSSKLSLAVAAGLALFAIGLATHQVLANRAAAAALAAANQQNARLQIALGDMQPRAAAAEAAAADLQKSLDAARAAATPRATQPARPSVSPALSPEAVMAGHEFVARHPEVKRAVLDLHRSQIAGQFGPFFKQRGFTPEQIEAFTNAMMHGAGVFRMVPDADGRLMVLSVPTWGDVDKRREEEAQLGALLGADGIRQLQAYIQLLPARKLTAQLAGALYFTPTPLTPAQADQFVQVVADVRAAPGARSGATDWNAILTHAQGVLLEPQLAALARFQAPEQFNAAMNQAILRNQQPGK